MYNYNAVQAVKSAAVSAIDVVRGYAHDPKARSETEILLDLAAQVNELDENEEECTQCEELSNDKDAAEERASDAEFNLERAEEATAEIQLEKERCADRVEEYRVLAAKLADTLRTYDTDASTDPEGLALGALTDALRDIVACHDDL